MTRSSAIRRARASAKRIAKFVSSEMGALGIKRACDAISYVSDRRNNPDSRARACSVLGYLKPAGSAQTLLRLFRTEHDETMGWQYCEAMGLIRDRRVTKPLLRMLRNTKNPSRRQQITYALWSLADTRSRPVYIELLSNKHEDETVRGFAAEGLGMLRPTLLSLEALISAVEDAPVYVRVSALCGLSVQTCILGEGARQVKYRAARRYFKQTAIPAIRARLKDREAIKGEGTVASYAASVLRNWKDPKRA